MGKALAPRHPKVAEQAFHHVLDLAEKLDGEYPNDLIYQRYLAFGSRDLADLLKAKQPEHALPLYQRSAEMLKKLAAQFPQHPLGRSLAGQGAETYVSLRDVLTRLGRLDEARAAHLEATRLFAIRRAIREAGSRSPAGANRISAAASSRVHEAPHELLSLGRTQEAITAGQRLSDLSRTMRRPTIISPGVWRLADP